MALRSLGVKPLLYVSWEIHEPSAELVRAHFPDVVSRGDFDAETGEGLVRLLRAHAVPDDAVVLGAAGPPCPDFSRIKGKAALGRAGREGTKCVRFAELLAAFRPCSPWRTLLLV